MYTQAMDTMGKDAAERKQLLRSAEEIAAEERFEARIDAGDFIEAKDWMPEHYRRTLVRQISSTRTPRSSACCPKATGSAARRP
jgi:ring-1,2-phenylacetyl-CoA epoxidase subunit PaaA